jgi:hypothetical protein
VAKKRRSESRQYNTLVRMDDHLAAKAKKVAALKGISMAEYFAVILEPIVDRDLTKEVGKLVQEQEQS